MPWAKLTAPLVGTLTKSGVEGGDGWISVIAGVIVALTAVRIFRGDEERFLRGAAIVCGVLVLALVIYEFGDVQKRIRHVGADTPLILASVGSGLYLVGAGAATAIVAGVWHGGRHASEFTPRRRGTARRGRS